MKIYKYHATQNDFIILLLTPEITLEKVIANTKQLCNRRTGIGADGILALNINTEIPVMNVINADATIAETCGNGLRAAARYLVEYQNFPHENPIQIKTMAGIQPATVIEINDNKPWLVQVEFPQPEFRTPFTLSIEHREFKLYPVSLANPHAVLFTEENPHRLIEIYGKILSSLPRFDGAVNIEMIRKHRDQDTYDLAVYERGVGITPACGSGTVAAAAVIQKYIENTFIPETLYFKLNGGDLAVKPPRLLQNTENYKLSGEAQFVFTTDINF